jgi:tRNA modification GTPase
MHKSCIDTIAAVSTPGGKAAISLIRVSGPDSLKLAEKLFEYRGSRKFPLSHYAYFGALTDSEQGRIIDKVLLTPFLAPNSYTGEDLVEISCHGNPVIVSQILELLIRNKVRPAEAGEFSRRAFFNGKMDLLEIEATSQLLSADTALQTQLALNQLDGLPSQKVKKIRDTLIDQLVMLEAGLNFPEDAIEAIDEHKLARELKIIRNDLIDFEKNAGNGSMISGGLKIAFLGRPNSGKSSLLNAILGRERAIVTDVAGTTRDTLEENFCIGSVPVKLIDTAGLRDSRDKIEKIGIERTKNALQESFLLIGVFDGSQAESVEDRNVMNELKASHKQILCVRNKIDLPQKLEPEFFGEVNGVGISALTGEGIDNLLGEISLIIEQAGLTNFQEMVLLGARQLNALRTAIQAIDRASEGIGNIYQDMLAVELEESVRELGRITGETVDTNTLDLIFERFCIGK